MSLLKLEHINTGYGKKQVLFDVTLNFEIGETVLIAGSNGSGKSTLLKCIAGIIKPWQNQDKQSSLTFHGDNIMNVPTHILKHLGISYVPQKNNVYDHLTVRENLEISGIILKTKGDTKLRIDAVLERFPLLKSYLDQMPSRMSGGERQILAIALGLVVKPKLLLLDEPTAGLSTTATLQFGSILELLKDEVDSIIVVEHRISEILKYADTVVGFKNGRVHLLSLDQERIAQNLGEVYL